LSEFFEFAAKIDELNEVGRAYDASLKGIEISTTPVVRSKLYIVCNNIYSASYLFEIQKSKLVL